MNNENHGKKVFTQPQVSELGQVSNFVQQNGLAGPIDGPIEYISGFGFSPHQS